MLKANQPVDFRQTGAGEIRHTHSASAAHDVAQEVQVLHACNLLEVSTTLSPVSCKTDLEVHKGQITVAHRGRRLGQRTVRMWLIGPQFCDATKQVVASTRQSQLGCTERHVTG